MFMNNVIKDGDRFSLNNDCLQANSTVHTNKSMITTSDNKLLDSGSQHDTNSTVFKFRVLSDPIERALYNSSQYVRNLCQHGRAGRMALGIHSRTTPQNARHEYSPTQRVHRMSKPFAETASTRVCDVIAVVHNRLGTKPYLCVNGMLCTYTLLVRCQTILCGI